MNYPEEFKQKFLSFINEEIEINGSEKNTDFDVSKALEQVNMNVENFLAARADQKFTSEDIIKAHDDKTYFDKLYKISQHNLKAKELLKEHYVISYSRFDNSKKR